MCVASKHVIHVHYETRNITKYTHIICRALTLGLDQPNFCYISSIRSQRQSDYHVFHTVPWYSMCTCFASSKCLVLSRFLRFLIPTTSIKMRHEFEHYHYHERVGDKICFFTDIRISCTKFKVTVGCGFHYLTNVAL